MNWLLSIRSIFGRFWAAVFKDSGILRGLSNALALLGNRQQAAHDVRVDGMRADRRAVYNTKLPYAIYILKSCAGTSGGSAVVTDCIARPAVHVEDILGGSTEIGATTVDGGFLATMLYKVAEPHHITISAADSASTLFNGVDYTWTADGILFHVDPARIGFSEVCSIDAAGLLRVYYRVFGWAYAEACAKDMVEAFESPDLTSYADIVWDMHQKGADHYNVRQLLGAVTDSVICRVDGHIDHVWTEQDHQCMLVGDRVYSSPLSVPCNFAHGDDVKAGDILFGSLRFYAGSDIPDEGIAYEQVPGIRVMTDAGELTAVNNSLSAIVQSGVNILPLTGEAGTVTAYRSRCVDLQRDRTCPEVPVPSVVNPFLFIMREVRRSRAVFASLVVGDATRLRAALACIRRNICAAGLLTVHVRAAGDIVDVTASGFTATAGNAAVAVDATLTVQGLFAEARTLI